MEGTAFSIMASIYWKVPIVKLSSARIYLSKVEIVDDTLLNVDLLLGSETVHLLVANNETVP